MAQRAQIVDITKSYLPGDPNAYVQSLVNTDREDGEEKTMPLMAYEGYNFLPTAFGYKSYFGTNAALSVAALTSRVQHVLLFQTPSYKNRLIALCEDGIWVCTADATYPSWVQVVTHTYDANVFEEWTWCVIENVLYMYKQGTAQVYRTTIGTWTIPGAGGVLVTAFTDYETLSVTDGLAGSGTFFQQNESYIVYAAYTDGVDFSPATLIDTIVGSAGLTSIDIAITAGTPPDVTFDYRIYVYDDLNSLIYYKDFTAAAFPISIPDMTGFAVIGAYEPGTLTSVGPPTVYNNDVTITSFVPTFLTMAGQMGIFRAGLRLGFWDSANSVSWSSNLDLTDFTPSIENLAGNTIFGRVVGRIVTCKGHGEGFVVYSTKSVVGATFTAQGNLLWDAKAVLDNTGIANSRAVACGKTDSEHFLFGTTGIYTIGKYNALAGKYDAEPILPEVYDLLKESRDPIYLAVLQDRYLCFQCVDDAYIYGRQSFSTGWANPYTVIIDWFVPSTTYPTATETILPEQVWEIIRQEMSGTSKTKRKDGEWVPRYTTTVDIMDDRYYSHWRDWIGEESTRLSYDDYATYLDTLPMNITAGDITTYLNPERPAAPPDAFRYGKLRTSTGIRAFWGLMGATDKENNEALIYGQKSEWDAFMRHQAANVAKIEAYELVVTVVTPYPDETTPPAIPANTNVLTVIGNMVSGEGNDQWLVTEGPTDKAAKEIILRRTFNKGLQVGKRVITVYTRQDVTNSWDGNIHDYPTGPWNAPTVGGLTSLTGYASENALRTALGALIPNFSRMITGDLYEFYGPVDVNGNYYQLYINGVKTGTDYNYTAYYWGITAFSDFANVEHDYTITSVATTTYEITDVTTNLGYSQFRALVTHWDRVRFGLYGDFTILETVAAEAMTAKIWEGTYPTDLGADREFLWSYGQYKAVAMVDLVEGTIGQIRLADAYDVNGTATPAITGYETEGITSLHSEYILPGTSFTLQTGSIEASYPTFKGSLVYDFQLKKWGKYKGNHDVIFDTTPVNATRTGAVTYTDLGVNAAMFGTDNLVYLFDSVPADSWIRYGKIGFYRQGFTDLLEVRASMRMPSDFTIITESSMDGKNLDLSKNTDTWVYDDIVVEAYIDVSARWHTVKISGNYDLTGLEIRAKLAGRR